MTPQKKDPPRPASQGPSSPRLSLPFPPLIKGILLRRYKRFLADVRLEDGTVVTAHTPNTGSMLACSEPGREVYLSLSPNLKRKYPHGWELIRMEAGLVGVNTSLPNRMAKLALEAGVFPGFPKGGIVRGEIKKGLSRLDLSYERKDGETTYIEVKNCTLTEDGIAYFPDAVSQRAKKHLEELSQIVRSGDKASILIMVQRPDARVFSPADHIDPDWGEALRSSIDAGVRLMVYEIKLTFEEATLGDPIPYKL